MGAAPGGAGAAAGCSWEGYAYAGYRGPAVAAGVAARIAVLSAPAVSSGHVGAWVGFGGAGLGPGGSDEWIQAGVAGYPDGRSELYYEVVLPGSTQVTYVALRPLGVGGSALVAVVESALRPGYWRVLVDGRPVSPPIRLPGSHGAWRPLATAETWDGDQAACNRYRYGFSQLAVAPRPGGGWQAFPLREPIQDPGYRVLPARDGFTASSAW